MRKNNGTAGRGYLAPPESMLGEPTGRDSARNIMKMHAHWAAFPACNGAGMADTFLGGRKCYRCGKRL